MKKIFRLEVKYWSYDGVNAINTLIDVIRAVKTSEDENSKDPVSLERDIEIISAYGFKYPPKLMNIDESIKKFEERFIYSYK
jgi:myo-inositol-1-phosphate synthase